MNSKERVMAAIRHEKVDRIPMFMDCTTDILLYEKYSNIQFCKLIM